MQLVRVVLRLHLVKRINDDDDVVRGRLAGLVLGKVGVSRN